MGPRIRLRSQRKTDDTDTELTTASGGNYVRIEVHAFAPADALFELGEQIITRYVAQCARHAITRPSRPSATNRSEEAGEGAETACQGGRDGETCRAAEVTAGAIASSRTETAADSATGCRQE